MAKRRVSTDHCVHLQKKIKNGDIDIIGNVMFTIINNYVETTVNGDSISDDAAAFQVVVKLSTSNNNMNTC